MNGKSQTVPLSSVNLSNARGFLTRGANSGKNESISGFLGIRMPTCLLPVCPVSFLLRILEIDCGRCVTHPLLLVPMLAYDRKKNFRPLLGIPVKYCVQSIARR